MARTMIHAARWPLLSRASPSATPVRTTPLPVAVSLPIQWSIAIQKAKTRTPAAGPSQPNRQSIRRYWRR